MQAVGLDDLPGQAPNPLVLVDVDLDEDCEADDLRSWLDLRPRKDAAIFAVDGGSRVQTVRAYSIGATDILVRPLHREALIARLLLHSGAKTVQETPDSLLRCDGISAGIVALQELFRSARAGTPLNTQHLNDAADTLMTHIAAYGFADWVRAVRVHHDRTYQHCLLVSGAAAAFAQDLGFSDADRRRVAIAGLLHDVGKARVSLAILDKPGKLDAREMAEIQQHVLLGHEALQGVEALNPEMLDMVLHHHEYMDGSGYPHGLRGDAISELTRVVTIADVFGALIERRAYKPPMSGQAAYEVLLDMGPKLDRSLVKAFELMSPAQFA